MTMWTDSRNHLLDDLIGGFWFAVVALLSLMNCAGGLLAAWRLVTEPPAASG